MTAPAVRQQLSEFCELLLEKDVALQIQPHKVESLSGQISRLSWVSNSSDHAVTRSEDIHFEEYIAILRTGDFSILLRDGGLIQVSVNFKGKNIVRHRLVYIPCSVHFLPDELNDFDGGIIPLDDFLDNLDELELRERLRVRSPVRFEYDPDQQAPLHPASHLHLGKSVCRIPVTGPVSIWHFMRFVFFNFYRNDLDKLSLLTAAHPKSLPRTICEEELREMHVAMP